MENREKSQKWHPARAAQSEIARRFALAPSAERHNSQRAALA
jgi:hypothetical protein